MEKRRVALALDNLLIVIGVWLLSYLWTRYYVMNLLVALIVATSIALCVVMLINLHRQKNKHKRIKQKRIDNIMNQFLYGGKDFTLDFLFDALNKKFDSHATIEKEFLILQKTAIFPRLALDKVSLQCIIDCFVLAKKAGACRIIILSLLGADKQAAQVVGSFPDIKIDIFDKNKFYDFLGWLGSFPEIKIELKPQKPSLKKLALGAISKNKSRQYFFISVVLMISSYFVAYSIYYIVAASVAFTLAVICKLNIESKLNKKSS